VHFYEPETKRQSIEYHQKYSHEKKRERERERERGGGGGGGGGGEEEEEEETQTWAGNVMATGFWDACCAIDMVLLEPGTTINITTLKSFKQ
jgi:hypothetical protein